MTSWKSLAAKLRRFCRLTGRERFLLLQAAILFRLVSLALRLAGFRRCLSLMTRLVRGHDLRPRAVWELLFAICDPYKK